MPGCSWRGHLRGVHIHCCPGVIGGDTCEGYIFITARVFLEGTPAMGTYDFHYCPGVLGGDTYDGGRTLVSSPVYYEVTPLDTFSMRHNFGGVTDWYQSTGYRELGTMAGVDIDTLTMEQYLALSRENQAPGVVKPEIGGNVNFEIKSQFMRELREDTFSENKNEDAHDHIDRVLNIVDLFNIPGVSKDAVMLRVFPFTLTGAAKRWVDRLAPGTINTWDLVTSGNFRNFK
ncbi:hypothetical protein Tco_0001906 [Tanacetum coccineum]